jgi:hypothetical protein
MLESSSGHVTVNERAPSQRFQRFVEEQIKLWIKENSLNDPNMEYEIAFFDEDPLGETSCLIVVQSGELLWRAWETADNPRAALKLSIEHLRLEGEDEEDLVEPSLTH